jgi:hypothetical protein
MLARPPWQTAPIRPGAFKSLEVALDWLVDFLSLSGVLVVRVDRQKTTGQRRFSLERRGSVLEGEPSATAVALFRHGDATESSPQSRVAGSHPPAGIQAACPLCHRETW